MGTAKKIWKGAAKIGGAGKRSRRKREFMRARQGVAFVQREGCPKLRLPLSFRNKTKPRIQSWIKGQRRNGQIDWTDKMDMKNGQNGRDTSIPHKILSNYQTNIERLIEFTSRANFLWEKWVIDNTFVYTVGCNWIKLCKQLAMQLSIFYTQ